MVAARLHPRFLVDILAKELGSRGITVNSIQPTAISGCGRRRTGCGQQHSNSLTSSTLMKRAGIAPRMWLTPWSTRRLLWLALSVGSTSC